MYATLKQSFARHADIDVILDRRHRERRWQTMPIESDRRARERRVGGIDAPPRRAGWGGWVQRNAPAGGGRPGPGVGQGRGWGADQPPFHWGAPPPAITRPTRTP